MGEEWRDALEFEHLSPFVPPKDVLSLQLDGRIELRGYYFLYTQRVLYETHPRACHLLY